MSKKKKKMKAPKLSNISFLISFNLVYLEIYRDSQMHFLLEPYYLSSAVSEICVEIFWHMLRYQIAEFMFNINMIDIQTVSKQL